MTILPMNFVCYMLPMNFFGYIRTVSERHEIESECRLWAAMFAAYLFQTSEATLHACIPLVLPGIPPHVA